MTWTLRFLGTGAAESSPLGHSSAVLERDGAPQLLIDCGPDVVPRFWDTYGMAPPAIFLTHLHLDHIGGMEALFSRIMFGDKRLPPPALFVHAGLLPLMQGRLADYPGVAAEGGMNFWDAFHLVPVSRGFWHQGLWYDVFGTRHHRPGTSFGITLRGCFIYTGDTRPIADLLEPLDARGPIAHDCALNGNPSHAGLDDIDAYPEHLRSRLLLYHYAKPADAEAMRQRGYRVAEPGEVVALPDPLPDDTRTG